jgi:predicted transcriptional regulator
MGRPSTGHVSANAPEELREHHRQIARLLIVGWKQSEISRHLGLTPPHVSAICSSPMFKMYLDDLREKAETNYTSPAQARKDEVDKLSQRALDVLASWLVDEETGEVKKMTSLRESSIQASIAKDMLDRAGIRAPAAHQEIKDDERKADNVLRNIYAELKAGHTDKDGAAEGSPADSAQSPASETDIN